MAVHGETILGRYVIKGPLGKGACGIAYIGVDKKSNEAVVIKELLPQHCAHGDEIGERFKREYEYMKSFRHRLIPRVHSLEAGPSTLDPRKKTCFIVMQLIEGEEVYDVMPLSLADATTLGLDVTDALRHIHGKGLIHRDIKPENVVKRYDGNYSLIDYGIVACKNRRMTRPGVGLGTMGFMSPEHAMGLPVDEADDLYSVGQTLYNSLSNELNNPFIPVPLSRLNPLVPHELERIIMKSMAADKRERYLCASAMRADLLAFESLWLRHKISPGVAMYEDILLKIERILREAVLKIDPVIVGKGVALTFVIFLVSFSLMLFAGMAGKALQKPDNVFGKRPDKNHNTDYASGQGHHISPTPSSLPTSLNKEKSTDKEGSILKRSGSPCRGVILGLDVRLRSSPGIREDNIIANVRGPLEVTITEKIGYWVRIGFTHKGEEFEGYVYGAYVVPEGPVSPYHAIGITTRSAELRGNTHSGSSIIKYLEEGEKLIITGNLGGWFSTELPDGRKAYVERDSIAFIYLPPASVVYR